MESSDACLELIVYNHEGYKWENYVHYLDDGCRLYYGLIDFFELVKSKSNRKQPYPALLEWFRRTVTFPQIDAPIDFSIPDRAYGDLAAADYQLRVNIQSKEIWVNRYDAFANIVMPTDNQARNFRLRKQGILLRGEYSIIVGDWVPMHPNLLPL